MFFILAIIKHIYTTFTKTYIQHLTSKLKYFLFSVNTCVYVHAINTHKKHIHRLNASGAYKIICDDCNKQCIFQLERLLKELKEHIPSRNSIMKIKPQNSQSTK